ncbi:hypothetical protein BDV97DRAFT_291335 [Delphinella strobiligena]|nr:hypothetical protein BDV97DRAFT_291335 [Delphinella strobiligena]
MRLISALQAAALCLASLTEAAKLTVSIPSSPPLLPNPATLPASTHATLLGASGQHYDARLSRSNTLVFKDLGPGSYLLNIHSRDYFFAPFRVDVSLTEAGADESEAQELIQVSQSFMGNEWSNLGPSHGKQKGELVVTLAPNGKKNYYQQREGFNILSFFKSPMILMGLFSVVMIFGMPYLMDNMDEETKAEFQEMQTKSPLTGSHGAAAQIQNFDLASWMAGKSEGNAAESSKASSKR